MVSQQSSYAREATTASTASAAASANASFSTSTARQEVQRLNAIVETQQAIAEAGLDLRRVMDIITYRMQEVTGATGAAIELAEGDEMVYHAASGSAANSVGVRLKQVSSLSGRCVLTGEILRCDDSETDDRVDREACRRVNARSMLVVPLSHDHRVAGVLKVMSTEPNTFGDDDVRTLQLMSGLTGSALGRAREYEAKQQLLQERTQALDALRESEERFRLSFENAAIGKALIGLQGQWLQTNSALCQICGYSKTELRGLTFQQISHPDDWADDQSYLQQVQDGLLDSYEREKRYIHKQGHIIWVSLSVSVVRDSARQACYLIAEIQDITERKQSQEQLAAYAQRLAVSNEELKNFAHVASHDLKSPLRGISSLCGLLERKYGAVLPDEAQKYLQLVIDSARRMDRLIEDVLNLSKVSHREVALKSVDLGALVRQIAAGLEWSTQETGAQIVVGELPVIEADESQMHQLFQNLIGNALKYQRAGATPLVTVQSQMLPDGEQCRITVVDNGVGFDQAHVAHVFQPFQRLHGRSEFEGSGIGLAICEKVVHRHGGTIAAQSTIGEGSAFTITLPLRQQSRESDNAVADAPSV